MHRFRVLRRAAVALLLCVASASTAQTRQTTAPANPYTASTEPPVTVERVDEKMESARRAQRTLGQRQTRADGALSAKPAGRISGRIANRVQNRLSTRIEPALYGRGKTQQTEDSIRQAATRTTRVAPPR